MPDQVMHCKLPGPGFTLNSLRILALVVTACECATGAVAEPHLVLLHSGIVDLRVAASVQHGGASLDTSHDGSPQDSTSRPPRADTSVLQSALSRLTAAVKPPPSTRPLPPALPWSSLGIFLVGHNGSLASREGLKSFLLDRFGFVCASLPYNTWLVLADDITARATRLLPKTLVADFLPAYRIATAWPALLDQARAVRPAEAEDLSLHDLQTRLSADGAATQYLIHVAFPVLPADAPVALRPVPGQPHVLPTSAAALWPDLLSAAIGDLQGECRPGCEPRVMAAGKAALVAVCLEDLPRALDWLSRQPLVQMVSPRPAARTFNIYSTVLTQLGTLPSAVLAQPNLARFHPLWAQGLDGTGEVIGLGDTGLALRSCYFADPTVDAMALFVPSADGVPVFQSKVHRKVVQYYAYRDNVDDDGHGSHISGTVAGVPLLGARAAAAANVLPTSANAVASGVVGLVTWSADNATGMAPAAKIAFFDLSGPSDGGDLDLPDNLDEGFYDIQFAAGARVQSQSWGILKYHVYCSDAQSTDQFLWDNPGAVLVFAAGNEGASAGDPGTIVCPATSKNGIAVGASLDIAPAGAAAHGATTSSVTTAVTHSRLQLTFKATNARGIVSSSTFDAGIGQYGDFAAIAGQTLRVAQLQPAAACGASAAAAAVAGAHVAGAAAVVLRGADCAVGTKAAGALAAGAALVVAVNSAGGAFVALSAAGAAAVPVAGVGLSDGSLVLLLLANSTALTVTVSYTTSTTPAFDDVASFSSFGPTSDGRMKPDLVAPGYQTASAATCSTVSNATCGVLVLSGTSMAAPVVSGAALLVRQYFRTGFYPTGIRRAGIPFLPSGVLIKATLLATTAALSGSSGSATAPVALLPPPSFIQGYGRLDLSGLPLAASSPVGWTMQVVDMAGLLQGQAHTYSLLATGGALTVTLAWYDWPADLSAAVSLVNDLDLVVTARLPGTAGGAAAPTPRTLLGNGGTTADRLNTVEKISITAAAAGQITITVTAHTVFAAAGRQRYALVVLGYVHGTLMSPNNPAWQAPRLPPSPPK